MHQQEKKLQDEIHQLENQLNEQDAYIRSRRNDIATLESTIDESNKRFARFKAERDELQGQRKYVSHIHTFRILLLLLLVLMLFF